MITTPPIATPAISPTEMVVDGGSEGGVDIRRVEEGVTTEVGREEVVLGIGVGEEGKDGMRTEVGREEGVRDGVCEEEVRAGVEEDGVGGAAGVEEGRSGRSSWGGGDGKAGRL